MACNVYGTPVTDATLKGMTEYHDKAITAVDRARVALEMKNAEGKDTAARNFVDTDQNISEKGVRCLFYNATGSPLELVAVFNLTGRVQGTCTPAVLQNGQWASFGYELDRGYTTVAVVYEASEDRPGRQWVLGWFQEGRNACYAEIREKGYYTMDTSRHGFLQNSIQSSGIRHEAQNDHGDIILCSMGNTRSPVYEAVMTMKDAM